MELQTITISEKEGKGEKERMKQPSIDEVIQILERSEKPLNDMIDWHIAFFQEPDKKRQELYYAVYESKRIAYEELMKELWRQYEQ